MGSLDGYKSITDVSEESIDSNGYMMGANIAIEDRFSFGLGLTGEVIYSTLRWDEFQENSTWFNVKMDYQF